MQAAFILAVFGSLFFVIMSMTTTMVESTQQAILRQQAQTQELFVDVERMMNEVLLKQHASIVPYQDLLSDGLHSFLAAAGVGSKWSVEQLTRDPWGSEINITYVARGFNQGESPIAAFGANQHATPIVHYFTISSPGRDRVYQTSASGAQGAPPRPMSYEDWIELRAEGAQGDDIIHTFSTRDALTSTWNRVQDVHTRMAGQLRSDYIKAVDTFLKRSDVRNLFEGFYSCVARGVSQCTDLPEETRSIDVVAINNCIAVGNLANGEMDWPVQGHGEPIPPGTYRPKMTTANCWMAAQTFKNMNGFPSMVIQATQTGGQICGSECAPLANQLGLTALELRDPLYAVGSMDFLYDSRMPTVVRMRRVVTEADGNEGWQINIDTAIDGEKSGT